MRMTHKYEISKTIDSLRRGAGMSQSQFGQLLGVSQSTASRKLSGEFPFKADEILVCSQTFHVSIDYLYGLCDLSAGRLPKQEVMA
ncbi:hypothetical protein CSQ85_11695 [Bifidobacterium rousetti]|nr:hypothetical protein CSQ85_11695 [Bifidobacterium rousetti]